MIIVPSITVAVGLWGVAAIIAAWRFGAAAEAKADGVRKRGEAALLMACTEDAWADFQMNEEEADLPVKPTVH